MKIKRELVAVFILIVFLSFLSHNVFAADGTVLDNKAAVQSDADKILNATKQIQDLRDQKKWDYLSQQWKEILLKNKFVSSLNGAFTKLNFLFVFLFAENYDLSLTLFIAVLLWIFFFSSFGRAISVFSTFSQPVSYIVAFCFSVILAHLRVYYGISLILFKIIFFKEGIWFWTGIIVFILLYLLVFTYYRKIIWAIGRKFKKTQQDKEQWDQRFKFKLFEKKMETWEKTFGSVFK